jgi:hypothetical protein
MVREIQHYMLKLAANYGFPVREIFTAGSTRMARGLNSNNKVKKWPRKKVSFDLALVILYRYN